MLTIFCRLYAFKRRCGLSPFQAARRALESTLRDARIYRSPK